MRARVMASSSGLKRLRGTSTENMLNRALGVAIKSYITWGMGTHPAGPKPLSNLNKDLLVGSLVHTTRYHVRTFLWTIRRETDARS